MPIRFVSLVKVAPRPQSRPSSPSHFKNLRPQISNHSLISRFRGLGCHSVRLQPHVHWHVIPIHQISTTTFPDSPDANVRYASSISSSGNRWVISLSIGNALRTT